MGLRLKIEGNESINLRETSIMTVEFGADIPHDSNAPFHRSGQHGADHGKDPGRCGRRGCG